MQGEEIKVVNLIMYKIKISLFLFFIVFVGILFLSKNTLAQDFNYETAYKDYQYNLNQYNNLYSDYKLSRGRYLQNKTPLSEEEAKKTTVEMLIARDETVRTYLTALRLRLMENQGISDTEKESVYKRIDSEVNYYKDHKEKLKGAGTINDLVKDSNNAKEQYDTFTQNVFYNALINISIGNTSYKRTQIERMILDLKTKIVEIKSEGDKDLLVTDGALIEIDNKLTRSRDKEVSTIDTIVKLEKEKKNKDTYYTQAIGSVQESYLYLKEIVAGLKEIVRIIKIK